MSFNPALPANDSPLDAAEMRAQLTSLKALIDAVPAGPAGPPGATGPTGATGAAGATGPQGMAGPSLGAVPIGGIVAWLNSFPGVPALPNEFVACNGQTLNDAGSPFDGQLIPSLNDPQRFLRGAMSSGGTGGASTHSHGLQSFDADHSNFTAVSTSSTEANALHPGIYATDDGSSLPNFYEVVWVMRVK